MFKKKMIEIVPERAFKVAKKAKDREMQELAGERMRKMLKEDLKYERGKDITGYSKRDQRKILRYLPLVGGEFLLNLLKPKD